MLFDVLLENFIKVFKVFNVFKNQRRAQRPSLMNTEQLLLLSGKTYL